MPVYTKPYVSNIRALHSTVYGQLFAVRFGPRLCLPRYWFVGVLLANLFFISAPFVIQFAFIIIYVITVMLHNICILFVYYGRVAFLIYNTDLCTYIYRLQWCIIHQQTFPGVEKLTFWENLYSLHRCQSSFFIKFYC